MTDSITINLELSVHSWTNIMPITSQEAVIQALANIRLESLTLPPEILVLIKEALNDNSIDTTYILNLLRA